MSFLQQFLLHYRQKTLPQFFLISPGPSFDMAQSEKWCHQLYDKIIETPERKPSLTPALGHSIFNHQDVLFLRPQKNLYVKEDLALFIQELYYRPSKLPYRFVFFLEAEKIQSKEVANSLLLSLESPPPWTIIIFLAGPNATLLPTIESRATKISLEGVDQIEISAEKKATEESVSASTLLTNKSLQDLLSREEANSGETETILRKAIYEELLARGGHGPHYVLLQKFIQTIQWSQQSTELHNSSQERILALFKLYQEIMGQKSQLSPQI